MDDSSSSRGSTSSSRKHLDCGSEVVAGWGGGGDGNAESCFSKDGQGHWSRDLNEKEEAM